MECPHCQSQKVIKRGFDSLQDGTPVQRYQCQACQKRFNERTGTPMARLRTSSSVVSYALNARTEGMGVRATGRTFSKSHATILRWEKRLADQADNWSPPAPEGAEVTLEGDEVYTRVDENLPPPVSHQAGLSTSLNAIVATLVDAQAGIKDEQLFAQGVQAAWEWVKACDGIRWFTDGERRYAQEL